MKDTEQLLHELMNSELDSAEEKKPVKRSYQKIQEDEDDEDNDYRSHTSPGNSDASATQLVKMPSFNSVTIKKLVFLSFPCLPSFLADQ